MNGIQKLFVGFLFYNQYSMRRKFFQKSVMILFFMTVLVSAQTSTAFPFDGLYFDWITMTPDLTQTQQFTMAFKYKLPAVQSCALNLANFQISRDKLLSYTAEASCSLTKVNVSLSLHGGSVINYLAFSIIVVTQTNANIELLQLSQTLSSPASSITLPGTSKFGYLSPVNRIPFVQWVTAIDGSANLQSYGLDSKVVMSFTGVSVQLNNTQWVSGIKVNLLITTRQITNSKQYTQRSLNFNANSGIDPAAITFQDPEVAFFNDPVVNGYCIFGLDSIKLLRDNQIDKKNAIDFKLTGNEITEAITDGLLNSTVFKVNCYNVSKKCFNGQPANNGQCPCEAGQYKIQRGCQTCPSGCVTCSSEISCDSCLDGYFLDSGSQQVCQSCLETCKTCSDSSTCDSCHENDNFIPENKQCTGSCPSGAYAYVDSDVRECRACLQGCQTCSDGSTCDSCLEGFYSQNQICSACLDECQSCSSSQSCDSCKDNNFLISLTKRCVESCLLGTYAFVENVLKECRACMEFCESCSDGLSCDTCISGYFKDSQICTACPSTCLSCSSASLCLTCQNGYFLSAGICSVDCPPHTFKLDFNTCSPCPFDCLQCSDSQTCTSCDATNHRELDNSTSRCVPMTGYFEPGLPEAAACQQGCISCISATNCSRCEHRHYFQKDGICFPKCKNEGSQYPCKECPDDCGTCNQFGQCITCPDNLLLNIFSRRCCKKDRKQKDSDDSKERGSRNQGNNRKEKGSRYQNNSQNKKKSRNQRDSNKSERDSGNSQNERNTGNAKNNRNNRDNRSERNRNDRSDRKGKNNWNERDSNDKNQKKSDNSNDRNDINGRNDKSSKSDDKSAKQNDRNNNNDNGRDNSRNANSNNDGNNRRVSSSSTEASISCPQNCISCSTPYDCSQCASGYQFVSSTSKCEPVASSLSFTWVLLPSFIGVVGFTVAVIAIAKYRNLKERKALEEEDLSSTKTCNGMMRSSIIAESPVNMRRHKTVAIC